MSAERSNQEWMDALLSSGDSQVVAIEDLGAVLLRAARYTLQRQIGRLPQFGQQEVERLAEDCAQEALVTLLKHLPEFRGESKFLTWAYKFAVNIGLTMGRREQWKGVSLDDLDEHSVENHWPLEEDTTNPAPELATLRAEVWQTLRAVMREELSEKQKLVFKWMVFDEVPMDVVVEKLETNRNAVYKLLHDARAKVKQGLIRRGIGVEESIDLFSS